MEHKVGGDYTVLKERSGIPLHVTLRWISADGRHAEIACGYSGTKRHKILAEKLLPWPYDPKAAKVAETPAVALRGPQKNWPSSTASPTR